MAHRLHLVTLHMPDVDSACQSESASRNSEQRPFHTPTTGHHSTSLRHSKKQPPSGQKNFSTSITQQRMQRRLPPPQKLSLQIHTPGTPHRMSSQPPKPPPAAAQQPPLQKQLAPRQKGQNNAPCSAAIRLGTQGTKPAASSGHAPTSGPPRLVHSRVGGGVWTAINHRRRRGQHRGQCSRLRVRGQTMTHSENRPRLQVLLGVMLPTMPTFSAPPRLPSWVCIPSCRLRWKPLTFTDLPMCRCDDAQHVMGMSSSPHVIASCSSIRHLICTTSSIHPCTLQCSRTMCHSLFGVCKHV